MKTNLLFFFFFFKQKTAYEMDGRLEFRRVLFRSLGEFGCHGRFCLGCSRVSLVERAILLGRFPPRALPRLFGTAGRSATHGVMAVARRSCFASATHLLRTPWASPVTPSILVPACRALRPRQGLQRSRLGPRLLLPSHLRTRSAPALVCSEALSGPV